MGAEEGSTPAKPSKPNLSAQETATTPSYPGWSNPMQAYYGAGAPPFYAATAASPSPHPYMWGSQHPFIPPYGTPVPYPPLYAPGGVYASPNMGMVPNMGQTNVALEGNVLNGKDPGTTKKSKGTSRNTGLIGGKGGENGKEASGSGYDGATQSAESGSEGSSDASDENNSQEYAGIARANAQNKAAGPNLQASVPGNSVVSSVPVANVNMGMDLWSASPAGAEAVKMRPGPPGVGTTVAPATLAGHEGIRTNQWTQDDRELKRQKRKQSNRESARRSRLRKQAECEELQERVDKLNNENCSLRDELQRLSAECEKLTSENNYIKEDLTRLCGPDAVSKLENNR
ncbi:G-box-binding factor 1 isoform X2 [Rhododendron vialii]|uniref:G-box-binding factor 1 isoform X2 n=1 Tax=Rhododendron vialii TaxID=182163 RepID=UPI0026601E5F|nr:G-box-binding factor 1 isoform X2 [Rhododendron vialii]